MPVDDHDILWQKFHDAVNMSPSEIEQWLETVESQMVGSPDGGESVGHASGRRIVGILRKKKAELDGGDYAHMRKVAGFIARHRGQGPYEEYRIPVSRWRYSLMNWGHDPLKNKKTLSYTH